MAGLDGIQNKIHPGDPMDKNLYDLPPEELKDVPVVCGSLREALGELRADHAFLLKGDVFSTRPDRGLYRIEMGGGVQLRAHPPPDRIPDVLLGLILSGDKTPAPKLTWAAPLSRGNGPGTNRVVTTGLSSFPRMGERV